MFRANLWIVIVLSQALVGLAQDTGSGSAANAPADGPVLSIKPRYYRWHVDPGQEWLEKNTGYARLDWEIPVSQAALVVVDVWDRHYLGFNTNMCLLQRDYGAMDMHDRGYEIIVVRDCTTGMESFETQDNLGQTRGAILFLEMNRKYSISSEELVAGLPK